MKAVIWLVLGAALWFGIIVMAVGLGFLVQSATQGAL